MNKSNKEVYDAVSILLSHIHSFGEGADQYYAIPIDSDCNLFRIDHNSYATIYNIAKTCEYIDAGADSSSEPKFER